MPESAPVFSTPRLREVDPANYRLREEVARGGVGRIIAASDVRLERDVALKMLHSPKTDETRFIREALLTARLQHPSIIPVHEVGRFPTGEAFIAMKLVRGRSLRQAIRACGTLEERLQLLPSVIAVSEALAYAHSERVIHRDLKPSNVLLGSFGETVVIDWGLAKHLDQPDVPPSVDDGAVPVGDATRTGAVLGTPAYMSPEQACGDEVDERADVFALGAILYELVCGAPPYEGPSATQVMGMARRGAFPSLRERAPGLPVGLVEIIERAMAPRLADRYRDASQLAAELRRHYVGQIAVGAGERADPRDPAIEAGFRAEMRRRAVGPLRTACALMIAIVPITGVVRHFAGLPVAPGELAARSILVAFGALILAASYNERMRRYSDLLAIGLLAAVAALVCGLYLRGPESEFAGSTASMVLVLLASSTLFHLPLGRMTALLLCTSIGFLFTSIVFEAHPSPERLLVQTTFFGAATVIALIGARVHYRVMRAEFYNRHRLEEANRRLVELERIRSA